MLRFRETKVAKEKLYGVRTPIHTLDVNFDNTIISKLLETKTNFKYLIGYLDNVIRPLVLMSPKTSG